MTIKLVGVLSQIGWKPSMLVTKGVTKSGPVITHWDHTLDMYQVCDNVDSDKI